MGQAVLLESHFLCSVHPHRMDTRGRVAIPAAFFQSPYDDRLTIMCDPALPRLGCFWESKPPHLLPRVEFSRTAHVTDRLSLSIKERQILGIKPDQKSASLVVVGQGDHFQVWRDQDWKPWYQALQQHRKAFANIMPAREPAGPALPLAAAPAAYPH